MLSNEGTIKLFGKPTSKLDFLPLKSSREWLEFNGNLEKDSDFNLYIKELSKFLLNSKKNVYVVGGELCSKVWNNSKIIDALNTKTEKEIIFICGPMFDIRNHGLVKLIKNNKIQLFYSPERQLKHYRVTDKGLFIESYHESFKPELKSMFIKESDIINKVYEEKFRQLRLTIIKNKVKYDEILDKFEAVVFDTSQENNYRKPNNEEIELFLQVTSES